MQPISRFASASPGTQDAQILSEIEWRYGSHMERLTLEDKLALRSVLSRYIYYKQFIQQYLIADAITDTMPDLDTSICAEILTLQGISTESAEKLIKFITDQQVGYDLRD